MTLLKSFKRTRLARGSHRLPTSQASVKMKQERAKADRHVTIEASFLALPHCATLGTCLNLCLDSVTKMAPQDVPILILGTWHTLPHVAKGLLHVTEDLELQRLSWSLQKGRCNHKRCPEGGVGRSRVMEERG